MIMFGAVSAMAGVVPNIYAGAAAPGSFLTFTGAGRSYQYVIDESQLAGLVGMNIVGMRTRLNETLTVPDPTANMSTTDLEVWIGPGVDPSVMGTNVAGNFTSAPTQVRDGAMVIAAGSFGTGNPAPFGPMVALDPWLYAGGDLAVFMTWEGWTGDTLSFDAALTSSPGYGTTYASRWIGSFNATELGNAANFLVTDFVGAPVPEPGSLVAIGLGLTLLAYKRRQR
jgi:hypothetical protein